MEIVSQMQTLDYNLNPTKMEVKLIKKTTKITGKEYFFVRVDGEALISETWCSDLETANQHLSRIIEGCKAFPEDKEETIKLQML
jgi:hypothetical protein